MEDFTRVEDELMKFFRASTNPTQYSLMQMARNLAFWMHPERTFEPNLDWLHDLMNRFGIDSKMVPMGAPPMMEECTQADASNANHAMSSEKTKDKGAKKPKKAKASTSNAEGQQPASSTPKPVGALMQAPIASTSTSGIQPRVATDEPSAFQQPAQRSAVDGSHHGAAGGNHHEASMPGYRGYEATAATDAHPPFMRAALMAQPNLRPANPYLQVRNVDFIEIFLCFLTVFFRHRTPCLLPSPVVH